MVKSYTWEEIEQFLVPELKKTKHILTFGTIGSKNVEKDIDLIITKKPNSPIKDFYKEIHKILSKLNMHLRKISGGQIIRFASIREYSLLSELIKPKKEDLLLQVMIYSSYPQMKKDWAWALLGGDSIEHILEGYSCILGNKKDFLSKEFNTEGNYDGILNFLYVFDPVNSPFQEKILIRVAEKNYDYLFRKRLGLKTPIIRNRKDVEKQFYQLCKMLDKLNKKYK